MKAERVVDAEKPARLPEDQLRYIGVKAADLVRSLQEYAIGDDYVVTIVGCMELAELEEALRCYGYELPDARPEFVPQTVGKSRKVHK